VDKLLLSAEEAAELLCIGRTRVYHLLATGDPRSVRIGRSRRIPAAGPATSGLFAAHANTSAIADQHRQEAKGAGRRPAQHLT